MKEHLPQLPKRFRIIKILPVSKGVLPPIRVSRLLPEGHGKCAHCGVEASHVITYTQDGDQHKVVYKNIFAWHRMMTADHFFPRSLGGRDGLSNLQLLCENCNRNKGNKLTKEELEEIKKNRHLYVRPNMTSSQIAGILKLHPYLADIYQGYNQLDLGTDFDIAEGVATEPFMHLISVFDEPKRIKAKGGHNYKPMKQWEKILTEFPQLHNYVKFGIRYNQG